MQTEHKTGGEDAAIQGPLAGTARGHREWKIYWGYEPGSLQDHICPIQILRIWAKKLPRPGLDRFQIWRILCREPPRPDLYRHPHQILITWAGSPQDQICIDFLFNFKNMGQKPPRPDWWRTPVWILRTWIRKPPRPDLYSYHKVVKTYWNLVIFFQVTPVGSSWVF